MAAETANQGPHGGAAGGGASAEGAPAAGRGAVRAHAQKLQAIARQAESFFQDQFYRLETVIDQCRAALAAAAADDRPADEDRSASPAELDDGAAVLGNEELEKVRREQELLVEAWTRLEAEQRELVARQDLLRTAESHGGAPVQNPEPPVESQSDSAAEDPRLAAAGPAPQGGPPGQPPRAATLNEMRSREAVLQQVRQLKREVRNHSYGPRRKK